MAHATSNPAPTSRSSSDSLPSLCCGQPIDTLYELDLFIIEQDSNIDLYTVGSTLFNYAVKGGMLSAGGGMLFISLATAVGWFHQPPSEHLLFVLGNYFLIGASIGGLVGLIVILRKRRE